MLMASKQNFWQNEVAIDSTLLLVEVSAETGNTVCLASGKLDEASEFCTVFWGDGKTDVITSRSFASLRHIYPSAGSYTIRISDDLASFAPGSFNGSEAERRCFRELVALGRKITFIPAFAFNNFKNMRGSITLPSVTTIGGYAFGSTQGVDTFVFPALRVLQPESFYAGPSPTKMYCDNVQSISGPLWAYYGGHLADLYIRGKRCDEIRAMANFPFGAPPHARIHGRDGIVVRS